MKRCPRLVEVLTPTALERALATPGALPSQVQPLKQELERRRTVGVAQARPEDDCLETSLLICTNDSGDAHAGWLRVFEGALPLRLELSAHIDAPPGMTLEANGLDLSDPFRSTIEEAYRAAQETTGQTHIRARARLSSPVFLPRIGGPSHGLATFLLAAFFLRYHKGPPPWLLATGELVGRYVGPVQGVPAKLQLAKRLGARLVLVPASEEVIESPPGVRVEQIPPDQPLDEVLALCERRVFELESSHLRPSLHRLRNRLVWIEQILIDQRRAHSVAEEELRAIAALTGSPQQAPYFVNERLHTLELQARLLTRGAKTVEALAAVARLEEALDEAASERRLDLRSHWMRADLENRYANVWLYALDFERAIEMAQRARDGFLRLQKEGLASITDVARVLGTLGHGHLYAARWGIDWDENLRLAENFFLEAAQDINPNDAPRNRNYLGELSLTRGRPEEAEEAFRTHLSEDLSDRLSTNLGFTLKGLAKVAAAYAAKGESARALELVHEVDLELQAAYRIGRLGPRHYPVPLVQRYLGVALARCPGSRAAGLARLREVAGEPLEEGSTVPQDDAQTVIRAVYKLELLLAELDESPPAPDNAARLLSDAGRLLEAFGHHPELERSRTRLSGLRAAVGAALAELTPATIEKLREEFARYPL